jgi:hypothetical protein
MKCKVGDLAFVVKPELEANRGVLVEVLRPEGRGRWWVKSLCGPRRATDGTQRVEAVAFDVSLQPIRAQGRPARKRYAANSAQGSLTWDPHPRQGEATAAASCASAAPRAAPRAGC